MTVTFVPMNPPDAGATAAMVELRRDGLKGTREAMPCVKHPGKYVCRGSDAAGGFLIPCPKCWGEEEDARRLAKFGPQEDE